MKILNKHLEQYLKSIKQQKAYYNYINNHYDTYTSRTVDDYLYNSNDYGIEIIKSYNKIQYDNTSLIFASGVEYYDGSCTYIKNKNITNNQFMINEINAQNLQKKYELLVERFNVLMEAHKEYKPLDNNAYNLVIPAIHGRDFWLDNVAQAINDINCKHIVFTGNYLDKLSLHDVTTTEEDSVLLFTFIMEHIKSLSSKIVVLKGYTEVQYISNQIQEAPTMMAHLYNFLKMYIDEHKDNMANMFYDSSINTLYSHGGLNKTTYTKLKEEFDGLLENNDIHMMYLLLNDNSIPEIYNTLDHDFNSCKLKSDKYTGIFQNSDKSFERNNLSSIKEFKKLTQVVSSRLVDNVEAKTGVVFINTKTPQCFKHFYNSVK